MDSPVQPDPLGRALEAFEVAFARRPRWAAAAPGRVNLIGEHTDYNDGFVMPIAIDRRTVTVGAPAADPSVSRLCAADLNQTVEADLRGPIKPADFMRGTWVSYVAGVFAGFSERVNIDLAIASSVPIGSGLASSAALEVAIATLLEQAHGVTLDAVAKALIGQRAEHDFAGVPCGIMDQLVSVMGRRDHALLIDCRSREATPVPMPGPDRAAIVVINTRVRHALASGEYAARRATCVAASAQLGVPSLRDATPEMAESRRRDLGRAEFLCARHVTTENARTLAAADALRSGDLAAMGRLMTESHASLRDDFRVSCAELDTAVELASGVPGVHGARMTGGGFGGCAIALCESAAVGPLTRAITVGYRKRHRRECEVFATAACGGAGRISR